ncbi:hypothetical protein KP509_38G024000 [Ceratopteris richardii]|uniref:EF-hand domain-containing protein n=1 Tax=Ceratopteris richardii TaxID=49495 RepID=A0A8T2Q3A3_CERRI|nr:hypothetical protein KP509_38G024000 [Ceratopteris richardii]
MDKNASSIGASSFPEAQHAQISNTNAAQISNTNAAPIALSHVLVALNETEEERTIRIRTLFESFDTARKGYLEPSDIEKGFKSRGIPTHYKYAKDLLDVCDSNNDGHIDFTEFSTYMDEKEMELFSIFREVDVARSGSLYPEELQAALEGSGIHLGKEELASFVDHIDKDNNGVITFEEWRDFLLLYPYRATIVNIYQYWEKVCQVDIGEQVVIPEGISRQSNAAKYLLAGGVAGALSRTATAPFDRLKVLLQVQTLSAEGKSKILSHVSKIYKDNGLVGFFRGNGLNILKVAPESAIKFYAFEIIKDFMVKSDSLGNQGEIGTGGRLIAGGMAGAVAQTSIYPLELLKTRLQTFKGNKSPSLLKLSKDIMVHEGPKGFYKGLFPSVLGIIPYAGIDLTTYESLKIFSRRWLPADQGIAFKLPIT